jgi:DNA repair exonuclease SbcCD ATPase subunit
VSSSIVSQERLSELESQLAVVKDERSELYKTQGQNAQRLLELNDILRTKEDEIKRKDDVYERRRYFCRLSSSCGLTDVHIFFGCAELLAFPR